MNNLVIGVTGLAGSGKDTFYLLLKDYLKKNYNLNVVRYALADELKIEVNDWCLNHYGIPAVDTPRDKKEIIRPLLVFHGNLKRFNSNGQHWINLLDKKIREENKNTNNIICITDIRYQEYERDEITWIKNDLNGILVHISMFENKKIIPGIYEKVFNAPPNDTEKKFDPIMQKNADFKIQWEKQPDSNNLEKLIPHIEDISRFVLSNK